MSFEPNRTEPVTNEFSPLYLWRTLKETVNVNHTVKLHQHVFITSFLFRFRFCFFFPVFLFVRKFSTWFLLMSNCRIDNVDRVILLQHDDNNDFADSARNIYLSSIFFSFSWLFLPFSCYSLLLKPLRLSFYFQCLLFTSIFNTLYNCYCCCMLTSTFICGCSYVCYTTCSFSSLFFFLFFFYFDVLAVFTVFAVDSCAFCLLLLYVPNVVQLNMSNLSQGNFRNAVLCDVYSKRDVVFGKNHSCRMGIIWSLFHVPFCSSNIFTQCLSSDYYKVWWLPTGVWAIPLRKIQTWRLSNFSLE